MNVKPLDPETVPFAMIRLAGKEPANQPWKVAGPTGLLTVWVS